MAVTRVAALLTSDGSDCIPLIPKAKAVVLLVLRAVYQLISTELGWRVQVSNGDRLRIDSCERTYFNPTNLAYLG